MANATKFRKRRFRRRTTAARRPASRRSRLSSAVVRTPNGIPDKLLSKYPYVEDFTLTSTVAPVGQNFINSMFDPNSSGIGHQPFMRDQLITLYSRYRCFKFSYELFLENRSSTNSVKYMVAPFNHSGTPGTMEAAWEKPNNKHGYLAPQGQSGSIKRITGVVYCPKVLGITNTRFANDDLYQTVVGASPTYPAYLVIATQAADKSTSVTVAGTIKLLMHTLSHTRAIIPQS